MSAWARRIKMDYGRKQALWFKSINESHRLFCNCGSAVDHIINYHEKKALWLLDTEGGELHGGDDGGISFVSEEGDTVKEGDGQEGVTDAEHSR
nr:MAG: ORF2 [Torque teno polar bear virus 43]